MKIHSIRRFHTQRFALFLALTIIAVGIGAIMNGCGKKDAAPANGSSANDSTHTSQIIDTTAIPRDLRDSTLIRLSYRLQPGETFRYKAVLKKSASGTFNDQPGSEKDESDWYFTLKVSRINRDSSFVVLLQYDSIKYTMSSDQNSVDFNSNDTTKWRDPRYTNWTGLLGLQFPVTVSSNGEILSVEGVEPVADRIFESRQEDKSALPADVPQQVVDQITDGEIKAIVGHVFLPMPEHAIAHDSTWSRQFTGMVEAFPTRNILTYKLGGYSTNGSSRSATVNSTLDVEITQRQLRDSTAVISMHTGTVTGDGASQIDLDKGIVRSKTSKITINLDYSSMGLGKYAGGKGHLIKTLISEVSLQML